MESKAKGGLLVGAGFLLGTVGIKALTSKAAKKVYVKGVAKGLQAKTCYEDIVEQAKAQVDDIVAEARYVNVSAQDQEEVGSAQVEETKKVSAKPASKK